MILVCCIVSFQSAVSVLSALMAVDPNNYDCLANLGIASLQR